MLKLTSTINNQPIYINGNLIDYVTVLDNETHVYVRSGNCITVKETAESIAKYISSRHCLGLPNLIDTVNDYKVRKGDKYFDAIEEAIYIAIDKLKNDKEDNRDWYEYKDAILSSLQEIDSNLVSVQVRETVES